MNRGTAVFVALAILVAHTLAIHQTPDGLLGAPYDLAHVAFRVGRNLAYDGTALWNPGGQPAESYPSMIWILVNAAAARVYLSPLVVVQALGLACALSTVIVVAQFSVQRSSGLIAPLLLAASGSVAASAFSGTEASLAMLLVTTAFLAFERGWQKTLAMTLGLLVLTRPEGLSTVLLLLAMEVWARPRSAFARRRPCWSAFKAALLVAAVSVLARRVLVGEWLSPFVAPLFTIDGGRWHLGALYLWSFVYASGFGLLLLALIAGIIGRRMSPTGARALGLALGWCGLIALSGGDGQPFWNALVPVLPLLFLAIQDCAQECLDWRAWTARVAMPILVVTMSASFLVSRVPGDLGPLRLEGPLTRWQTPRGALAKAYPRPLGRLGLLDEIRSVEHLRTLGVFLKDRIDPDASILTFWPGAIGYLSRKEVLDLSGRAWPLPGARLPLSWRGAPRVDVLSSLSSKPDYLVPLIGSLPDDEEPTDFLRTWLERYDIVGATEERLNELLVVLGDYELVYVPVPVASQEPHRPSERPFALLQRREQELTPTLELEITEERLLVLARHEGHQLVVDLCVRAVGKDGTELFLEPTGSWSSAEPLDARTSLLMFPTGARSIQMLDAALPAGLQGGRITAWLHNPGMRPDAPLSRVSAIAWVRP